MSEKPEILFATLAAGGSHVSSANAMAQAGQAGVFARHEQGRGARGFGPFGHLHLPGHVGR
ncbi:MAG: hypothetical protein JRD92_17435 [Deltaproteobacteria bacterium]|nr:hypothetical protein [Deltaproteobacteria bacterium]